MSIDEIKPQELKFKLKKLSTARVLAYFKKYRKFLSIPIYSDDYITEEEAKIQNEINDEKWRIFKNELATRGHVD